MTLKAEGGDPPVTRRRATEARRARILEAMAEVVAERGFAGASVRLVTARARVSRRTYDELFASPEECLSAVFDLGLETLEQLMTQAFQAAETWQEGMRTGLAALLLFLDSEPSLAQVWLVESLAAGGWALKHRERNLDALRDLVLTRWQGSEGWSPPPLAAEGVIASVLGLVHAHLVAATSEPLITLLAPLMGVIASPYLTPRAVAREIERGDELARRIQAEHHERPPTSRSSPLSSRSDVGVPAVLRNPNASRARECLLFLDEHANASNREVALGIGVAHPSQISKLLRYLLEENLVFKRSQGAGRRNAWHLTARGQEIARILSEHGYFGWPRDSSQRQ